MAISIDRYSEALPRRFVDRSSPGQVQRHGVPDPAPLLLAAHPAAAGRGLVPGRPLLHPPVHRVQSRDSPGGQILQVRLCNKFTVHFL